MYRARYPGRGRRHGLLREGRHGQSRRDDTSPGRTRVEGEKMNSDDPPDERFIYRERFQGVYFDFRGKSMFARYDRCEFVECTLLIDHATVQLAFTACVLKDWNI